MSEQSGGPGWWVASDGKWYPPHLQPAVMPPPPPGQYAAGPPLGYQNQQYAPPRTNGFAIASLVLGLVWLWFIGSILALIFGYKAKREIDASNGQQTGRGMAVAGIVLGWIGTVGTVLLIVAIMMLGQSASTSFSRTGTAITGSEGVNIDPADGYCNPDRYLQDPDC